MKAFRFFIKSNRIIIKPITDDDLPMLMTWWNDGRVMVHVGYPQGLGLTINDMKTYMKKWRNDQTSIRMIICLKDATPIGETAFHNYRPELKETEIGIKICRPELWGQGLGTEALQAMTNYAFLHLGVKRVLLNPSKTNIRIIHVNQKCGYRTIGEKDGGLLMELKKSDWQRMKG